MLDFIKKNIFSFGIIVLISILLFKDCNRGKDHNNTNDTLKIESTTKVIEKKGNTIIEKPIVYKIEPYLIQSRDTSYLPDTNYAKLLAQYNKILDSFFAKKTYKKEYLIDTFGTVAVNNEVLNNTLYNQEINWTIKIPTKTDKIILREPKRNIFYLGGGVQGSKHSLINQVNLGIALKNKKEEIFNINTGVGADKSINYSFNYFTPIKFRK